MLNDSETLESVHSKHAVVGAPIAVAVPSLVEQVLANYGELEPNETDSWPPVGSKYQLGYRLNLYYCFVKAMGRIESSMPELRVVDLGCGTGRSARMYLDVGLLPEQVTGLDFRPGAIARARKFNPALAWDVYDGGALPTGFNLVAIATVFSSVATRECRNAIVARIRDGLPPGGYVFYYDLRNANDFAGGDQIDPEALFSGFEILWKKRLGRFATMPLKDCLRGLRTNGLGGDARTPSLRELIGDVFAPSHEAYLLQKV